MLHLFFCSFWLRFSIVSLKDRSDISRRYTYFFSNISISRTLFRHFYNTLFFFISGKQTWTILINQIGGFSVFLLLFLVTIWFPMLLQCFYCYFFCFSWFLLLLPDFWADHIALYSVLRRGEPWWFYNTTFPSRLLSTASKFTVINSHLANSYYDLGHNSPATQIASLGNHLYSQRGAFRSYRTLILIDLSWLASELPEAGKVSKQWCDTSYNYITSVYSHISAFNYSVA